MTLTKEEKVLAAARDVFTRYGFKRTTMSDLAEAAQMSRPALYLVFSSKEEVFRSLMAQVLQEQVDAIHAGIYQHESAAEKLIFAFEIWCVGPFTMVQLSPDAKDIFESGYTFAAETMSNAYADFEKILSDVLQPIVSVQTEAKLSSGQIAHILSTAVVGFKESAASPDQLRQMIAGLIMIVLAGLQNQR
jgi:AcrR family transcriptional regulator